MLRLTTDDDTIEVFVDNLKSVEEDRKPFDDSSNIEVSVDRLLLLTENRRALENNRRKSDLFHGLAEILIFGGYLVFPLRVALRFVFFISRNAIRPPRVGSVAQVQNRMKILTNALSVEGPVFVLIGIFVFLFMKISIFPVLNTE